MRVVLAKRSVRVPQAWNHRLQVPNLPKFKAATLSGESPPISCNRSQGHAQKLARVSKIGALQFR